MDHEEDLALVEKVKQNDRAAFDILYTKYKKRILNYIYRLINNRALAEEITQEAFIKAYTRIQQFKPNGTFSSWLYAIARNETKNELRKMCAHQSISLEKTSGDQGSETRLMDVLEDPHFNVERALHDHELGERITNTLSCLPYKYREVIILCVIQGLPYEEAARILNCSKETIAIRLYRARKKFITIIGGTTRIDCNEKTH